MSERSIHLRAASVVLVLIGGTCGTAAREALGLAFPADAGVPHLTLGINLVGAFLLGVLLDGLVRRGPDRGRRRRVRLALGTGFLGGFTTYSALATDSARLIDRGDAGAGMAYALGTVVLGAVATWVGIAVAAATHRRGGEGEPG